MNIAVLDRTEQGRNNLANAIRECLSDAEIIINGHDSYDALHSGLPNAQAVFLAVSGMLDVEAGRKLAQLYPELPLVVVCDSPDYSVEAFAMGARQYLVLPLSGDSLTDALRRCHIEPE